MFYSPKDENEWEKNEDIRFCQEYRKIIFPGIFGGRLNWNGLFSVFKKLNQNRKCIPCNQETPYLSFYPAEMYVKTVGLITLIECCMYRHYSKCFANIISFCYHHNSMGWVLLLSRNWCPGQWTVVFKGTDWWSRDSNTRPSILNHYLSLPFLVELCVLHVA